MDYGFTTVSCVLLPLEIGRDKRLLRSTLEPLNLGKWLDLKTRQGFRYRCYKFTEQVLQTKLTDGLKNLGFLRHKEMRHVTSSRLKQSSFLLDRLHKPKAWSRRKFLVEEAACTCRLNQVY